MLTVSYTTPISENSIFDHGLDGKVIHMVAQVDLPVDDVCNKICEASHMTRHAFFDPLLAQYIT